MQFRDTEYYRASLERMAQAQSLAKNSQAYALSMYCSGLAVECLLRAFRWREDKSFDGRHDLSELLKASGILRINDDYMRRRGKQPIEINESSRVFRAAMTDIAILWHNSLRYASEQRLRSHLTVICRGKRIKGDLLKWNASRMIDVAQSIINKGLVLWGFQTKS